MTARTEAVEDLAAALADLEAPGGDDAIVDRDLVVEARDGRSGWAGR